MKVHLTADSNNYHIDLKELSYEQINLLKKVLTIALEQTIIRVFDTPAEKNNCEAILNSLNIIYPPESIDYQSYYHKSKWQF